MRERIFTNDMTIDGYRIPYLLMATVCDGYKDQQDVSTLYEKGLDYPFFYYDPVIYGRAKTSMRKDRVLT